MNFTISLPNLGVYIEKKLKLGTEPHVDGSMRQILKYKIKVDSNSCWLEQVKFLSS